jgi:hypothetical protein
LGLIYDKKGKCNNFVVKMESRTSEAGNCVGRLAHKFCQPGVEPSRAQCPVPSAQCPAPLACCLLRCMNCISGDYVRAKKSLICASVYCPAPWYCTLYPGPVPWPCTLALYTGPVPWPCTLALYTQSTALHPGMPGVQVIRYSKVTYTALPYSAVQCSAVQCSAVQCNAVPTHRPLWSTVRGGHRSLARQAAFCW